jgi:hypothetical protein
MVQNVIRPGQRFAAEIGIPNISGNNLDIRHFGDSFHANLGRFAGKIVQHAHLMPGLTDPRGEM